MAYFVCFVSETMVDITLPKGSRAFITGTSGSGKTTLALKLAEAMPSPLVIIDTKPDPGILKWAKSFDIPIVTKKMPDWKTIRSDVVIRPPDDWIAYPDDLDWWLGQAFKCRFVPSIYIDEGTDVGAVATKLGQGVSGLWRKGRALGFRTMIGAQRPAFITQYVITESDFLFIGRLQLEADRKKLVSATGLPELMRKQKKQHFIHVDQTEDRISFLKPIDITNPSVYSEDERKLTRQKSGDGKTLWQRLTGK